MSNVLKFENVFARGGMYQCGGGTLTHLRERLLDIQVSLSPTLGKNEKVEQHIKKKTRKPNVLRFWLEGDVIPLYVGSCLIV